MRFLTLIRHAKSSWDNPLLRDFDRPLNPRGLSDAPLMGEVLRNANVTFDIIVSSPAVRAITTAQLISKEVHYRQDDIVEEPRIYEASPDTLLEVIHDLDARKHNAALVGHNPGFTELANLLVKDAIGELPTCAIVRMSFEVGDWSEIQPGLGRLIAYDYPKKYKRG